jgi:hypothetical protein
MTRTRRRERLAGELGTFVQQYRRKAQRGAEPNDRRYSGKVEQIMTRLRPEELSDLLNDDRDEAADTPTPRAETHAGSSPGRRG